MQFSCNVTEKSQSQKIIAKAYITNMDFVEDACVAACSLHMKANKRRKKEYSAHPLISPR